MAATTAIGDLDVLIADVQNTPSGLIEAASLIPILNQIRDMLQSERVILVPDVATLQLTSSVEGLQALVKNVGHFVWEAGSTYNYTTTFPAAGGGRWRRQLPSFSGLPTYANNTAALAGGLVAGDPYRNGDVLNVTH